MTTKIKIVPPAVETGWPRDYDLDKWCERIEVRLREAKLLDDTVAGDMKDAFIEDLIEFTEGSMAKSLAGARCPVPDVVIAWLIRKLRVTVETAIAISDVVFGVRRTVEEPDFERKIAIPGCANPAADIPKPGAGNGP
jgi:hypothetical protein